MNYLRAVKLHEIRFVDTHYTLTGHRKDGSSVRLGTRIYRIVYTITIQHIKRIEN